MTIAYFDCIAGISGDMALGALVGAGADLGALRSELGKLPIEPFDLEVEETDAHGLRATRVTVRATSAGVIRTYANIRGILDAAGLPGEATALAQRIFRRLAEAEAAVHRKEIETITFHEVGAVDSIVDIVGTALALEMLGVQRAYSSAVPTGLGMTATEHGAMPIPGPAVVELLRGAPVYSKGVAAELTTPTGAAILSAVVEGYGEIPPMRLRSAGYGAGTLDLDFPNVLRVLIGDEAHAAGGDRATTVEELILETNVDDLNPELYAYVLDRLLSAGARDAWLVPIVMKKGRPAVTVRVLCSSEREADLQQILFRETGTLGVRSSPVSKTMLGRETIKVETRHGAVAVKVGLLDGRAITVAPEFEDCTRVAGEAGIPARDVYEEATRLARAELGTD
jgi:pyridinium-3,5-bisthiocarboxylic acid mononucleotide nickel chelatase